MSIRTGKHLVNWGVNVGRKRFDFEGRVVVADKLLREDKETRRAVKWSFVNLQMRPKATDSFHCVLLSGA